MVQANIDVERDIYLSALETIVNFPLFGGAVVHRPNDPKIHS